MTKREWLWRGAGVAAAVAVCGMLCLFVWLAVLLVSDLPQLQLPAFATVLIAVGVLAFGLGFVPATGAVMGLVAAGFWRHCAASKIALNHLCSLSCLLICLAGCARYPLGFLFFLMVFVFLTQAMWWGLDMGLHWLPRQPWRYFLGQIPELLDEIEPD